MLSEGVCVLEDVPVWSVVALSKEVCPVVVLETPTLVEVGVVVELVDVVFELPPPKKGSCIHIM